MDLLTILLDHPANIQDITFNAMQVGTIIGGVLGIAGVYFANKHEIQQLKATNKSMREENQERKDDTKELQTLMNKRVDASNQKIQDLEKGLGAKMERIVSEIKGIEIKIGDNHNALLAALLKNKR